MGNNTNAKTNTTLPLAFTVSQFHNGFLTVAHHVTRPSLFLRVAHEVTLMRVTQPLYCVSFTQTLMAVLCLSAMEKQTFGNKICEA